MSEELRMNIPFNHAEEHRRDIQPHIDAIFEKCKELDIPCLITVCHTNEPKDDGKGTENGIALAVNFCGPNKTPPTYILAAVAIEEGPRGALQAAIEMANVKNYRSKEIEAIPASE